MPTQLPEQHGVRAVTGPARRTNPVGTISDVKLGHLVGALGRYKPVLAVVGVIILLAVILEGPEVVGGTDRVAASNQAGSFQSRQASPTPSTTTTTRPDSFAAPSPLGGAGDTANTPRSPSSESTADSENSSPSYAYTPPASSPDGGGTGGSRSFDDDAGDEPLTIAKAAWASQSAGTPLAATGVPEDSLPVGTRLGQHDKRSFIALSGDEISLTLFPVEGDDGHRSPEDAVIQACQITESGWEEGEAISFDEAPPYDPEDCVDGARNDDGSWTFSLIVYPERTDGRGFALVPGPDAPIDFQVAFARTT